MFENPYILKISFEKPSKKFLFDRYCVINLNYLIQIKEHMMIEYKIFKLDRYFILNLNYLIQINVQVIRKYKYSSWIDKIKQIEYKRWVIKQNSSYHFFDLSECSMTTQWHNKIFISMTRDQYNSKYSEVWKLLLFIINFIYCYRSILYNI